MSRKKEIIISLSLTGAVLAYSTVSLFAPAYAHVEQTSIWAGRIPDAEEQPDQKDLLVTGGQTILLNTIDGKKKIPLEIPEGGLVTLTVSDPHWIEAEIQTDDDGDNTLIVTSPLWQEMQEETEEPADGENPDGTEETNPSENGTEDADDSSDTSSDASEDDSKDTSKDTDGSEDASDGASQDTSDDASESAGSTKSDSTGKKDTDTKAVLGESLKAYLPLLNNKTADADKTSGTAASGSTGASEDSGATAGDKTGTSSTGTAGVTTGDKTGTGTTGGVGTTTGDKTSTGTTDASGTDATGASSTTTGDKTSTDTEQAGNTSNSTRDGMEMRPDHEWVTVTWTQNAGSLVKSATFDLGVSVDEDEEAADKKEDAGSETDDTKDNTDGANSGTGADSTGTDSKGSDSAKKDARTDNTKSDGTDASAKTEQKTTMESLAPIVQAADSQKSGNSQSAGSQKSVSSQSTGTAAQGNNAAKSTARLTMGISVVPKKETKTYAGSGLIMTHVSSYDPKIGILVTAGEEGAVVLCNGKGFPAGTRYTEDGMTYFLYEEAPLRLAPSAMAVINLSMTDISGDLTLSAGEGCEITLGQQDLDLDDGTDAAADDTTLTGQNTVKPVGTVVTPEQALIVGASGQKVAVVSIPDAVLDVESVERLETVEQGTAWVPDDTVIASMDTGSTLYLKPRDSAAGTYRVTLVWSQGGQAIYRKAIPFYIFYAEGEEHE